MSSGMGLRAFGRAVLPFHISTGPKSVGGVNSEALTEPPWNLWNLEALRGVSESPSDTGYGTVLWLLECIQQSPLLNREYCQNESDWWVRYSQMHPSQK